MRRHVAALLTLVLLPGCEIGPDYVVPDSAGITAAFREAIWPPMRVLYALGYHKAAEKRLIPLYISMPPIYIFVLGSLIGGMLRAVEGG